MFFNQKLVNNIFHKALVAKFCRDQLKRENKLFSPLFFLLCVSRTEILARSSSTFSRSFKSFLGSLQRFSPLRPAAGATHVFAPKSLQRTQKLLKEREKWKKNMSKSLFSHTKKKNTARTWLF